jgi:hypothetical protein
MVLQRTRADSKKLDNFVYLCMTQAEMALDGQDPGRMAEALRSILQGAYDVHACRLRAEAAALAAEAGLAPD